jgi:hypothetical protein
MAQLVAIDLAATGAAKQRFAELKASHHPDLRGGMEYLDSPRHANYVETHTHQHVLAEVRDSFGWPPLDDGYFAAARRDFGGAARRDLGAAVTTGR